MILLMMLVTVPGWAGNKKIPSDRPTDQQRGKELYERHCIACHGARNHGDGPATQALVHTVPDLAGKIEVTPMNGPNGKPNGMLESVDEDMVRVVMRGEGAMPAFAPSFPWPDARRVVFYMGLVHDLPEEAPKKPTPTPDKKQTPDKKKTPATKKPVEPAEPPFRR